MNYFPIKNSEINISSIGLGTWAFGCDKWWGHQDDRVSISVLEKAQELGVNLIDTAPIYGRGHSEKIIGEFLKAKNRQDFIISSKVGLSWEGRNVTHDLSEKRMRFEIDQSRKNLDSDYIDIYQIHWPDKNIPIAQTAATMHELYEKGIIKSIGISNHSLTQIKEFSKYAPLHVIQPPFNMFRRNIGKSILPFCIENNITVLSYIPLHSGILTGKFFIPDVKIPNDLCRKHHIDLKEPLLSINKATVLELENIADRYNRTLTQLVINWTKSVAGIGSVLVGSRSLAQLKENTESLNWEIEDDDFKLIDSILKIREEKIRSLQVE